MLVGVDETDAAVDADLSFEDVSAAIPDMWESGNFPVVSDVTGSYGGVAVYQPVALAAGTGCLGHRPNTQVGQTPQKLARQLARLPRSTVVQAPTPVHAFGRDAVHLRLRIDQHCGEGVYRVAQTQYGGHGISYGDIHKDVVMDFWVEDVRKVPLVVETWHQEGASSQMVDDIARTRDSITFVTGG